MVCKANDENCLYLIVKNMIKESKYMKKFSLFLKNITFILMLVQFDNKKLQNFLSILSITYQLNRFSSFFKHFYSNKKFFIIVFPNFAEYGFILVHIYIYLSAQIILLTYHISFN
jgi:hypothetical protein